MKKVYSLFLITALLSSCGIFRDVKKEKFSESLKAESEIVINSEVEEREIDSEKSNTIDKGVVVTERETIKKKTNPGAAVEISADMIRLKNGETIRKDSAGVQVAIILDSLNQRLKISINTPPTNEEETTKERIQENRDLSTGQEKQRETDRKENIGIQAGTRTDEKAAGASADKQGKNSFWALTIFIAALMVVWFLLFRWFRRK